MSSTDPFIPAGDNKAIENRPVPPGRRYIPGSHELRSLPSGGNFELQYLIARGAGPGPLFRFNDGRPLTRNRFVTAVREALTAAGVEKSKYCGHSFRIGAATTAAKRGVEDCIIKTLGRWESTAYLQYVKIPRRQLTSYSRILGAPSCCRLDPLCINIGRKMGV